MSQIVRTKIILPRRRPHLLSRSRLITLFQDLLDCKLIIIIAPAGYGKTSLLIDAACQTQLPTCWYAIDGLDTNPKRFFQHFIAAIAHQFPAFGHQATAALTDLTSFEKDRLDHLLATITNEIYTHISEEFLFVLDDYHLVNDTDIINYFVNRLAQQVDEHCHLVITSRTALSLPDLVLLIGRSEVGGLGLNDLAFQAEEIRALLHQNYNLTIPEETAATLVEETEGWVTGLLMSTQTMAQGMADRLRLARASGMGIHDYMAQQVFEQQSPAMQDFLLRTSLLPAFNASLCESVLGQAQGTSWDLLIDAVIKQNLFVVSIDAEGTWLRYHHLFQDFLQHKISATYPQERNRILRRLAQSYIADGQWEDVYNLYRQLGDTEAIIHLIKKAGFSLIREGQFILLSRWLDDLPETLLRDNPILLSLQGITAVNLGQVELGLRQQNQAVNLFRKQDDKIGLARALVDRAISYNFVADYEATLTDINEALTLVKSLNNALEIEAKAVRVQGQSLRRLGKFQQAIECWERALTFYNQLDDEQSIADLNLHLAIAYMDIGHFKRTRDYYSQAFSYWQKTENLGQLANLYNNQGVCHFLQGEYKAATTKLEEAVISSRQIGDARIEAFSLSSLGDVYADLDALEAAALTYNQAQAIAEQTHNRFLQLYLNLAQTKVAWGQDQINQAKHYLQQAKLLAQESESRYEQAIYQMSQGWFYLMQQRDQKAISLLHQAKDNLPQTNYSLELWQIYLYLAIAYHHLNDKSKMQAYLQQAFDLAAQMDSQHPLTIAGMRIEPDLKGLQDDELVGSLATNLLNEITIFEQNKPRLRRYLRQSTSLVPFDAPQLVIQALGQARVALDDKVVSSAEWRNQPQTRELFFYLLSQPNGVNKETLSTTLWPDDSPEQLKLKFKNALYRLRRALGREIIIFNSIEDLYCFNRNLDYEYDVELFQAAILEARSASVATERQAAYEMAVEIYQGPYLPELDGLWVWPQREQLTQAYIEAHLALAQLYLDTERYDAVLGCCQQILTAEPSLEEAYQQAMRAYAALGNRAAVIRLFERCKQALKEEIGVPVSLETENLYKALTE